MKYHRTPRTARRRDECSHCGGPRLFDGLYRIYWCKVCDYDIPGLSPGRPPAIEEKETE